jgi:MarR family transcriptional regulator, negative regulator of the multidrug operon emrRAB
VDRTANLLGALGVALVDLQHDAFGSIGRTTPREAAAINAIGQDPGSSIAALSLIVGVSHAGAVRLTDRLVARGLAERRPGPDLRTVGLHLTAAGRKRWRRTVDHRSTSLEAALEKIPPELRGQLNQSVAALLRALTIDEVQADRTCRFCDEASCPQETCPVTLAVRQRGTP